MSARNSDSKSTLVLQEKISRWERWQNPYQLNTARKETDIKGNAYRLQFGSISGSNFSLDLAYVTTDVEDDLNAGTDLARDAESYYAKGGYRFTVSRTSFLVPSVTYIQHDADGRANSFDSYGTDISWFNILGRHSLVITAGYARREHHSASILFNKARSDDEFSLFAAYEYPDFMQWKDWSFVAFTGYGKTQSSMLARQRVSRSAPWQSGIKPPAKSA